MTKRTHLGLRLMGLVVLMGVAIWPKDREAHRASAHDRGALHVAAKAQVPAQLMIDDGLRARRAPRAGPEGTAPDGHTAEPAFTSDLTN